MQNRPSALRVGRIVYDILQSIFDPESRTIDSLGSDEVLVELDQAAIKARALLARELKTELVEAGVQINLLRTLGEMSEDPDVDVPDWLAGNTPVGIERPITPRGVFPSKMTGELEEWTELHYALGNYSSYSEYKTEADALLEKERAAGWLDWAPTLATLERKHGPIHRSKIGVIAKLKGGRRKIRLIHDLRRSGVNARIKTSERVVLPKLTDVVEAAMSLMKKTGSTEIEYMTTDFRDAFKQLRVHPHEQRYLGGEGLKGFFVYMVVLFGNKSGPLLWCRTAAFLMRLTVALVFETPTLLECFVDDPIVITAGPRPARRKTCG